MAACSAASGNDSAPAARAAACYQVTDTCGPGNYGQWFLPSLDELNQLAVSSVGGLTPNGAYWSSSQVDAVNAWYQGVGFGGGNLWQDDGVDKLNTGYVRAVRAF